MKSTYAVLTTAFTVASAFCQHGTTLFPRSADHVKVANYNFAGMLGPLNWYGMNKTTNSACAKGKNQSPINVVTKSHLATNGSNLAFDIQTYNDGAELINLGSTLEVVANGTLGLDGKTYKLAQFHFHTPSEHRIDDEYYPAEVHFVFQADDASLSVVGFPIELDSRNNRIITEVFKDADKVRTPGSVGHTGKLDFKGLKRHLQRSPVYQYKGSLTTPPCTEGIYWNLVRNPIHIDVATYKKIKGIMKFNSRYTQNEPGQINLLENAYNQLKA